MDEVAALKEEIARLKAERDEIDKSLTYYIDRNHEHYDRAVRAEARLDKALSALQEIADEELHRIPGVNPDGSVSTHTMAQTLAAARLAEIEGEQPLTQVVPSADLQPGQAYGVEWVGDEVFAWIRRDGEWVKLAKGNPLSAQILAPYAAEIEGEA